MITSVEGMLSLIPIPPMRLGRLANATAGNVVVFWL